MAIVAVLIGVIGLLAIKLALFCALGWPADPASGSAREKLLIGSRDVAVFCAAGLVALLIVHFKGV